MAEAGMHSPLEQFEIRRLFPVGGDHAEIGALTFTNSSLTMVAALVLVSAFLILGMRRGALVPGRMQSLAELSYEFVARSEEHTSELQSLMRISYAVFCLNKKKYTNTNKNTRHQR